MKSLACLALCIQCALAQIPVPPGGPPTGNPPGDPAQRPGPMLLPQVVVLHRQGRSISIDGSLVDWPELPGIPLNDTRQLSGTAHGAWRGPDDLSAFAFLLWDEDDLYLACTVKDEWHRALDEDSLQLSEIPTADCVVFSFDPARDTRSIGPDRGRTEDREFWFADERGHHVVQWDRFRGTARMLPEDKARLVVSHDKELGITTYEAKVPWTEILPFGRAPVDRLVLDLQIVVNDFDESTDPMPQTRIGWTFGCGERIDPGLFGSIMLVRDTEALRGQVPEFPPKPATDPAPLRTLEYWQGLTSRLLAVPPAVHDGSRAVEAAGGTARLRVLEEIEDHLERFPRVDFVEYQQRIHRRMTREVAGIGSRGLPWWWNDRLRNVSKAAETVPPNGTARLFRLPQGGWLVRGPVSSFTIDPAGAEITDWIWGGCQFVVLTQPMDLTRRNDQLLVRMAAGKPPRPVLTHIAFHLPLVSMVDMPLVELGKDYEQPNGVLVSTLGRANEDGSVPYSCGYRFTLPAGPTLLIAGPMLRVEDVSPGRTDVLLLSPRNPIAPDIAAAVDARLTVIDDGFLCQTLPNAPRVSLALLHALQRALQPRQSLVLAPGESWDITLSAR